jgi:hypothetical protein
MLILKNLADYTCETYIHEKRQASPEGLTLDESIDAEQEKGKQQ